MLTAQVIISKVPITIREEAMKEGGKMFASALLKEG
jgi:hypothetical protein